MAANDYYNTSFPANGQHPQHGNGNNAPLPSLPGNQSTQSISPVPSPFDDHRYEYSSSQNLTQHQQPPAGYGDTGYYGASNQNHTPQGYQPDPFADHNAIPLRSQSTKIHRLNTDPEGHPGGGIPHKKKGWFSGRVTWVVYILTTVQVAVFVGELIKNGILTGTPIQIKPRFNIVIGPSFNVLITMGARYTPCMHKLENITDVPLTFACPNSTSSDPNTFTCSLKEVCGMSSGVPAFGDFATDPNQWWRFIVPIFLHAGIIHIGFNMLLQWTLGRDMEKEIGSLRFALVYFSAGIFGFVLGGNYAAPAVASTGASGALFGILALVLLDLLYNWRSRRSPFKDLLFLLLDIVVAFVLGLFPTGLDNFSHIGGFCMGIALGICLLHSPAALRERIGGSEPPYATVAAAPSSGKQPNPLNHFVKQPVSFFKGRKPLWWAWWLVRVFALVGVFIGFILLLKNFYEWRNTCAWCKHLTCLPIKDWCDIGQFKVNEQSQNNNGNNRRALSAGAGIVSLATFL